MDNSDNVDRVRAFLDSWKSCDADRITGFMSDDCFYHNVPIDPVQGRAEIRAFLTGFLAQVEEANFELLAIAESEDGKVLTERVDRFRINGQWLGLRVMGIFELEGGEISNWRDYYDQAEMDGLLALAGSEATA